VISAPAGTGLNPDNIKVNYIAFIHPFFPQARPKIHIATFDVNFNYKWEYEFFVVIQA
jgi:hypothetical protein